MMFVVLVDINTDVYFTINQLIIKHFIAMFNFCCLLLAIK